MSLISKLGDNASQKKKLNSEMIEKYLSEKQNEDFIADENPYLKEKEANNKKYFIKSLLKELSDQNQTKRGNY